MVRWSVWITRRALLLGVVALLPAGCGEREGSGDSGRAERADVAVPDTATAEAAGAAARRDDDAGRILIIGTSLTAGQGVAPETAYPARLQERIDSAGLPYRVVSAGVSGETSAGALRRLDWLLREPAEVVVVETGANDMLRGQDPDSTRANLNRILDRLKREDPPPRILLVPMRGLPNLGREYTARFEALYAGVADSHRVRLLPFLLEGVAGDPALNQPDGIHPNADGHERIARNLWPALRAELTGSWDRGSSIEDRGSRSRRRPS